MLPACGLGGASCSLLQKHPIIPKHSVRLHPRLIKVERFSSFQSARSLCKVNAMRFQAFVFLLLSATTVLSQTNPVQVATVARFDLLGNSSVGSMTNGYVSVGDGAAGRQDWIAAEDQPRSYTVNFTASHFSWTPATFKFTPASNGIVTLTLRGPYELSTNGLIYKQEVLWDAGNAMNS